MTDDTGGFYDGAADGGDFDEAFFATLEAAPEADPAEAITEDFAAEAAIDLDGDDGADGFQYEAEGDGSFETDATEFELEDFPFDLGGEA